MKKTLIAVGPALSLAMASQNALAQNSAPTAAVEAASQAISIARSGSQPSAAGAAQTFTGTVRIDPLFRAKGNSKVSAGLVTFEPKARTAWHTHPLGQTLIVTAGSGRVQRWGDPVQVLLPGDVVSIPAGQKHWHGASPTTAVTHIAIQEAVDGKNVEWLEHVTDEQYGR